MNQEQIGIFTEQQDQRIRLLMYQLCIARDALREITSLPRYENLDITKEALQIASGGLEKSYERFPS